MDDGKSAGAGTAFKDAPAIEPSDGLANRALALFYLASDRAVAAEPCFKKSVELVGFPDASLALADYPVGMKRPADALES